MLFTIISYSIPILALLVMMLMLSRRNVSKQGPVSYFRLFLFCLFLWLIFLLAADLTNDEGSILLIRLAIATGGYAPFIFYVFSQKFLGKDYKVTNYILGILAIIFTLLSFNKLMIDTVSPGEYGVDIVKIGPAYVVQLIYAIVVFCISFILMWLNSKKHKDIKKQNQVKLITYSAVISILLVSISALYPRTAGSNLLVPLAITIFAAITFFIIMKHSLFDVRLIVARSIAYSLSIAAIIGVYSLVVFGIADFAFDESMNRWQIVFFAVFSALTALFFQPIKKFFDKISNSLFYRDAYDGQSFLNEVNSSLVNKTDLKVLLEKTAQVIKDNLKVDFCNFYIDSQALIDFHIVGTKNSIFANSNWSKIYNYAGTKSDRIFTIDQAEEANVKIRDFMHEMGIEIIMQLKSGDQVVGQMIIGQKLSGNAFTDQDTQVLQIIADEVAIAVQNTLRFEEIAHFNITMQQEINTKTAELKKSNQKLKELDEAKDEFISMASHQLRTPLTSVKGYISMMLEGDTGKLSSKQAEFLNQAFVSSQRMVYLIADLLNISRLKTGKFVIEAKPTYLPDVVEEELDQLYETAKSRGLELTFDKPNIFPMLDLDETKIRQVIMNYVDNAIYYTPSGGHIKVNLIAKKDKIEFKVIDDGLGVPKADQPNLFTKFYRATNAKKARPDGTGLGLYMAQKVVTTQGGSIIFSSKEGEGSTFGFSFPVKS